MHKRISIFILLFLGLLIQNYVLVGGLTFLGFLLGAELIIAGSFTVYYILYAAIVKEPVAPISLLKNIEEEHRFTSLLFGVIPVAVSLTLSFLFLIVLSGDCKPHYFKNRCKYHTQAVEIKKDILDLPNIYTFWR